MRTVSLNARTAQEAASTASVEVMLITIEHALLSAPIRLSTDPTERLSTEPLRYGTRSPWLGADPATDPYLYILMSATLPSDQEDAPAAFSITLTNVDNDIAKLLRSFTDLATVHMALVFSDTPDVIEQEARNLSLMTAEGDAESVPLYISREAIEEETVPMDRFTRHRFPGLFPVMSWSDRYIGLPAVKLGRDWAGVDCWGLLRLVYREELTIDLPSYAGDYTDPAERDEVSRLINAAEARGPWQPAHSVRPFDALVFGTGKYRTHIGVAVDRRHMLHVHRGEAARIERYDEGRWQGRFKGAFMHIERRAS